MCWEQNRFPLLRCFGPWFIGIELPGRPIVPEWVMEKTLGTGRRVNSEGPVFFWWMSGLVVLVHQPGPSCLPGTGVVTSWYVPRWNQLPTLSCDLSTIPLIGPHCPTPPGLHSWKFAQGPALHWGLQMNSLTVKMTSEEKSSLRDCLKYRCLLYSQRFRSVRWVRGIALGTALSSLRINIWILGMYLSFSEIAVSALLQFHFWNF